MAEQAEKVGSLRIKPGEGLVPRLISTNIAGYAIVIGAAGEFKDPINVAGAVPNPLTWISASSLARAHASGIAGENYFHQRRFGEAVREFQMAVRLEPGNPLHHYRLAYSAWRANDLSL